MSEKILSEKKLSRMLSWISSVQSELSRTNRCLSLLSGIHTAIVKFTSRVRPEAEWHSRLVWVQRGVF